VAAVAARARARADFAPVLRPCHSAKRKRHVDDSLGADDLVLVQSIHSAAQQLASVPAIPRSAWTERDFPLAQAQAAVVAEQERRLRLLLAERGTWLRTRSIRVRSVGTLVHVVVADEYLVMLRLATEALGMPARATAAGGRVLRRLAQLPWSLVEVVMLAGREESEASGDSILDRTVLPPHSLSRPALFAIHQRLDDLLGLLTPVEALEAVHEHLHRLCSSLRIAALARDAASLRARPGSHLAVSFDQDACVLDVRYWQTAGTDSGRDGKEVPTPVRVDPSGHGGLHRAPSSLALLMEDEVRPSSSQQGTALDVQVAEGTASDDMSSARPSQPAAAPVSVDSPTVHISLDPDTGDALLATPLRPLRTLPPYARLAALLADARARHSRAILRRLADRAAQLSPQVLGLAGASGRLEHRGDELLLDFCLSGDRTIAIRVHEATGALTAVARRAGQGDRATRWDGGPATLAATPLVALQQALVAAPLTAPVAIVGAGFAQLVEAAAVHVTTTTAGSDPGWADAIVAVAGSLPLVDDRLPVARSALSLSLSDMVDVCIPPGRNRALHLFARGRSPTWRIGNTTVVPTVRLVVLECFSYAVYAAAAASSAPDFYTVLDARLLRQVPTLPEVSEGMLAFSLDAAYWVTAAAAHRDAGLEVSLVLGETPSLLIALDATLLGLSTGEWHDATATWHLRVASAKTATALARLPLPASVSWSSNGDVLLLASPSRDVDDLIHLLAGVSALRAATIAFGEQAVEWHGAAEGSGLTVLVPGGDVTLTVDYLAGSVDKGGWLTPLVTLRDNGPVPDTVQVCLAQALRVSWRRNHVPAFANLQPLLTGLHAACASSGGFAAVDTATLLPRTTDQEAAVRLTFVGDKADAEMVRCLVC